MNSLAPEVPTDDTLQARRFSVAPMMDWTDRHCRSFHRLLTRHALLYTEMITTGAVLHGDRQRLLRFDAAEHPVALQLGGSDPRDLAQSRPHRAGFRLRRDQSQCRLSVRSRAGRPLRRLPDGGAAARRRMRRRDEAGGENSGHREMPHRHRRSGSRSRARCAHRRGEGGRRRCADRACAQGLAQGSVAAREPRYPAARLRSRLPAEGGASRSAYFDQWRRRLDRGGARSSRRMSTA